MVHFKFADSKQSGSPRKFEPLEIYCSYVMYSCIHGCYVHNENFNMDSENALTFHYMIAFVILEKGIHLKNPEDQKNTPKGHSVPCSSHNFLHSN